MTSYSAEALRKLNNLTGCFGLSMNMDSPNSKVLKELKFPNEKLDRLDSHVAVAKNLNSL